MNLPPLWNGTMIAKNLERPEDIPVLAEYFARQEGAPTLPADIRAALSAQSFPGNVRELRNAVRAYVEGASA